LKTTVFSSSALPAGLDHGARVALLRDHFNSIVGSMDVSVSEQAPFFVEYEFLSFGDIVLARSDWTVDRITRNRASAAADPRGDFYFTFNQGAAPSTFSLRGRTSLIAPGAGALVTNSVPGEFRATSRNATLTVCVPQDRMLQLVANAEDLLGIPLDPKREAVNYLRRYLAFLMGPGQVGHDAALTAHVANTLTDLVVLSLTEGGDAAQVARTRGLRGARLHEVLMDIRARFADPAFSVSTIAARLGISERYVNDVLYDTGATFTERVLELRLQKARTMLADVRNDRLRVSEIALACGFNDVSYFNRSFRRRFGASPTQFRGQSGTPS
jgi:AraC-like DNA-binding protein